MLCLFLRLPYRRRTTRSKRKANKPLAIDKDQRSTPRMNERASELQSLFSLESAAQTGLTSTKLWLGLRVWPRVPGMKLQEHFHTIASNGAILGSPLHPHLPPCSKPSTLELRLLQRHCDRRWHQPLPQNKIMCIIC